MTENTHEEKLALEEVTKDIVVDDGTINVEELQDIVEPKEIVHQCDTCYRDPSKCFIKPNPNMTMSKCCEHRKHPKPAPVTGCKAQLYVDGQRYEAALSEIKAMSLRMRSEDPDHTPNRNEMLRDSYHIANKLMEWGDLDDTLIHMDPAKKVAKTEAAAKKPKVKQTRTITPSVEIPDFEL